MTVKLAGFKAQPGKSQSRKVSLGTIPDFAFEGVGYRLDGVVPDSAAERAGLRKMDIIVKIEDQPIKGLRDLSNVLKSMEPGQGITIYFQRDNELNQTQARLSQR